MAGLHPCIHGEESESPHLPALKRLLSPATWIRVAPFASGGHPARSDEPRPTCPPFREASMNMERLPMERHSHRYERMQPEPAPEGDASSSSSCSPSAPARRSEVLAASASFRLSEAMRVFRSSYAPPSSQSHAPTLATSPPTPSRSTTSRHCRHTGCPSMPSALARRAVTPAAPPSTSPPATRSRTCIGYIGIK